MRGGQLISALSSPIEAKPVTGTADTLFTFVLVKPTHYDDDGYPIQWFRSALPSNTLACMNSLAEDASKREVLGPGVRIEVDTYDETNRRVFPSRIIRDLKRRGGRALIGIVGVQSNQFPRAVDIAQFHHFNIQDTSSRSGLFSEISVRVEGLRRDSASERHGNISWDIPK